MRFFGQHYATYTVGDAGNGLAVVLTDVLVSVGTVDTSFVPVYAKVERGTMLYDSLIK